MQSQSPDVEEEIMAAGGGEGVEAPAVVVEQLRACLEQGWTIVQDVDKVDGDLRNKLGVELEEEVEDGVVYISLKSGPASELVRVKEVVGELKPEKERLQRGDVSNEWVPATPELLTCRDADEAVVLFTLKMQPYYRKEGPAMYGVKVELLDIIWDGKLEKNGKDARGFFVDEVTIRLTAVWTGDDRCPRSFCPPGAPNDPVSLQNSKQTSVQAGLIGSKPTAAVTLSESTTQGSSSQPWTIKWERTDEMAILKLRHNMWCSGSGSGTRKYSYIPYNTENPKKGKWVSGDVPQLPPPYDGNFTGLPGSDAPSAGWIVQASTFKAKKVCWKPEVSARVSKLRAQTGAELFLAQRQWDKRVVLIKPKGPGLVYCLPPALTSSFEDGFTTSGIIIALLVAFLAGAVVFWQLPFNISF